MALPSSDGQLIGASDEKREKERGSKVNTGDIQASGKLGRGRRDAAAWPWV
jgi:hypothetical protein